MNQDCLKLSCYFGERQRSGGRFVADNLLDLYSAHDIAVSIMLRGVEGFGRKHQLRTDQTLTLSEDLPAVAVAVDTRDRIEPLLGTVTQLHHAGLITLERARLARGEDRVTTLPEDLHQATKLTVYLGRGERAARRPAFVAVCDLLHRRGIAGATVLLGVDGTVHGQRERARFIGGNTTVPAMILAVGSGARITEVLPDLNALGDRPLTTFERVQICKRDGHLLDEPHPLPGVDEHGMAIWQKISIFSSEAAQHGGQPLHRALTRALQRAGANGATSLRGVWGFHGAHKPHGDRLFQLGRHVPTLTVVIDSPDTIAAVFPIIDELTAEGGLVTSELVPAVHAKDEGGGHGGLHLATHRW